MSSREYAGYAGPVSLPMSGATPEMLEQLVDAMRGRVVEGIRIHDARASTDIGGHGIPMVRVVLLVDDPQPDEWTWPVEKIRAIDYLARREAWQRIGIPDHVYTTHVALCEAEEGGFPGPRGAQP